MDSLQEKKQIFLQRFNQKATLTSTAPGRVNLIGEHTDYNNGWVFPAAIDKVATILLAKNSLGCIRSYAYDLKEHFDFPLIDAAAHQNWGSYIYGVVRVMQRQADLSSGFDILVSGDVPFGAGLSSSAAIECALANGLNELFELGIPKKELAFIAQKAEHDYVGVQCGIMDQYASIMGKKDHAMFLDCKTVRHEYVPLELGNYLLLLCNTNVSHSLADSEYNTRREQCEMGVGILKKYQHNIQSLRDVSEELLHLHKEEFPDLIFKRCLYVIQENNRVKKCVDALKSGNLEALGLHMYEAHWGLSEMYEVSCDELDFLVEQTKENPKILGSRMMGGGFGGCTINIIHKDEVQHFIQKVSPLYLEVFGKEMTPIIANIGEGCAVNSE